MPAIKPLTDIKAAVASLRADLIINPSSERLDGARALAIQTFKEQADVSVRVEVATILAQHYHTYAEFDLAYEWLDCAQKTAIGHHILVARVVYTHAGMLNRERRGREALELLTPYTAPDAVASPPIMARIQTLRAGVLDSIGLVDEADQAYRVALELREKLDDKMGLATVYYNYGEFCMRRDDEDRAMEYFVKSYDIERSMNNHVGTAQSTCMIATLYARRGERDLALQFNEIAKDSATAAGVPIAIAVVKANAAEIYEGLKDETAQLAALLDAKTYLDRYPFQSIRGQVLGNLANMYINRGVLDAAEPLLEEALSISEKEEHRYAQGYWLFIKGKLRNRQKRYAEAIPILINARDQLAAIQAHVYTLLAFSELAQAQAGLGATSEAYATMAEWASSYVQQHNDDLETRMRRVQRMREQEKRDRDQEIYRLRTVELASAIEKLEATNGLLEDSNVRLNQVNKDLVDLASEKDEFMAIAAHDLRNPLADMRSMLQSVIGHYDLLGREDIYDINKELLGVITRMEATIHAFLEISRTDRRSAGLNIDRLDLVRFAHRASERHSDRADHKDIIIKVVNSEPSVWAMGDPSIVDAVMDNLVSNAIKFSPLDSIVTIEVASADDATITVSDQGPGIAQTDIPKLFTKYAKLSSKPTAGEDSIGLGLYLAKRMAERMKGTIEYADAPQGGATFIFRMPVE